MKRPSSKITASEREVLELLWDRGVAMTSADIVKNSQDKSWKPSYIHLMITSLLKKNLIDVAGFQQTTKNFARTFAPTMTREEFSIYILREENHLTPNSLITLFATILKEENVDEKLLDRLSDMLEEKRKELEGK